MANKNRLYPHLMPREIPIWEAWLQENKDKYDKFEYDVRVGESIVPPPGLDANIAEMAVSLAKKRIDVVAFKDGNPLIIEIKDYAGLTAIGQLVSYPLLYIDEFPESPKPGIMLLAQRLLPDVARILEFFGIAWDTVDLT